MYLGLVSYAEVVPQLFAWAHVKVHEETYDGSEYQHWEHESTAYDEDGNRFEYESFEDWRARQSNGLRPYDNGAGEVDFWRLELTLGDLGKAFLVVDEFAMSGSILLTS